MIRNTTLDKIIKKHAKTFDEKEELWTIVQEIVHHRVIGCVLDNLPKEHHEDFLNKLNKSDFEEDLISYLNVKSNKNMEKEIRKEVKQIESEILKDLKRK
ncbi:hypothetical protein BH10PAT1_BH10PAT1_5430 [soil metagenome]